MREREREKKRAVIVHTTGLGTSPLIWMVVRKPIQYQPTRIGFQVAFGKLKTLKASHIVRLFA